MTSELEYLESDCEITVLPQPKAPGMAVVPPWTHLGGRHHGQGETRVEQMEAKRQGLHTGMECLQCLWMALYVIHTMRVQQ